MDIVATEQLKEDPVQTVISFFEDYGVTKDSIEITEKKESSESIQCSVRTNIILCGIDCMVEVNILYSIFAFTIVEVFITSSYKSGIDIRKSKSTVSKRELYNTLNDLFLRCRTELNMSLNSYF